MNCSPAKIFIFPHAMRSRTYTTIIESEKQFSGIRFILYGLCGPPGLEADLPSPQSDQHLISPHNITD